MAKNQREREKDGALEPARRFLQPPRQTNICIPIDVGPGDRDMDMVNGTPRGAISGS